MPSKRSRLRPSIPSRRNSHTSRGNSASQPAAAVQILQAAAGVAQERELPVLPVPGGVVGVEEPSPAFHRPVQQGGHRAGCGERDDRARDGGGGLDLPLVVPALQRVLQFQLQLPAVAQRPEVEAVVAVGLAEHDELADVRPADRLPAGPVVDAERRASPASTACSTTARRPGGRDREQGRARPAMPRGPACRRVPRTRGGGRTVPAGTAVTASRHDADREFLAAEPLRGRRRGELVEVGAASVRSTCSSGPCKAPGCAAGGRSPAPGTARCRTPARRAREPRCRPGTRGGRRP